MKVGLDATPLTVPSGGVRRYTEELSRALAENFPDEFWLLSDQPFELPVPGSSNLKRGQPPNGLLARRWWLWGLRGEISRLGLDVFHGTDFAVPYLPNRPSVMTLQDLSPWMKAAWQGASNRVRRRTPILLRLGLATMVITPSKAVRKQAIEHFRLDGSQVIAIPDAAAAIFRPRVAAPPSTPYLIYAGTLELRKNISLLLDAWREVRRGLAIDLVLVGCRRPDFPEVTPETGLRVLGFRSDEELAQLFSGALACVYPSYYEGFGLPVLEAMQCGAAVIASRDPAISEVAGQAAILVEASDSKGWVEAIRLLASEPDQLRSYREKGLARAAEFSWPRTARLTREVYAEAIARFRQKT